MRSGGILACVLALTACARTHGRADLERFDSQLHVISPCDQGTWSELELEERSPLGFSAREVLDFARGEHSQTLRFDSWDAVPRELAGAEEPLRVSVRPTGEPPRFFDARLDVVGHGLVCSDWLEITVEVHARSEDGTLDERFEAALLAPRPYLAVIHARPSAAALASRLQAAAPEGEIQHLDMRLALSPFGIGGELRAALGRAATAEPPAFGYGPRVGVVRAPECDDGDGGPALRLPADTSLEGVALQDALDRFAIISPVRIGWGDAPFAALSFGLDWDGSDACLTVDPYDFHVSHSVAATLRTASDDGQLDGEFPGRLSFGGSLEPAQISFRGGLDTERRPAPPVTPAELGFPLHPAAPSGALFSSVSLRLDARDGFAGSAVLSSDPRRLCPRQDGSCDGEVERLLQGMIRR